MLSGPQQKFVEGIVSGLTDGEAYAAAYPKSKHPGRDAGRLRSEKNPKNPEIEAEIARLRKESEKLVVKEFAWKEIDALNWCLRVIQTPIGEVGKDHDLCQEYSYTTNEHGGSERFKMPAKMDAVEKIIRLKKWVEQKIELTGNLKVVIGEAV